MKTAGRVGTRSRNMAAYLAAAASEVESGIFPDHIARHQDGQIARSALYAAFYS